MSLPSLSLPLARAARPLVALAAALLVSACGGGGDGPSQASLARAALVESSALANVCTPEGEKRYARALLDDIYLWWHDIVDVDPSAYPSVAAYFDALRVRPNDRFSTVMAASRADAMLQSAASPSADGVLVSGPSGGSVPMASTLTSAGGRRVGYLLFNDQRRGAQDALIPAVTALQGAGVQDLVLDMRYNGGGYLYVAQSLASMVAGPAHDGQVFERLAYNDKRAAAGESSTLRFTATAPAGETTYAQGTPLPRLSLPRVYVLASGMTCSASESVVNALRGVGVEVVLVGGTTCGKPYGFVRRDNCGQAYFAIEFKGTNAQGFGDYAGGFAPTCPVAATAFPALGSPQEPLLAAALRHIDTGACPAAATARSEPVPDPLAGLAGRLLLKP